MLISTFGLSKQLRFIFVKINISGDNKLNLLNSCPILLTKQTQMFVVIESDDRISRQNENENEFSQVVRQSLSLKSLDS